MFLVNNMLILDQQDVTEMQLVDEDFNQTSISPVDLKKRLAEMREKADQIDATAAENIEMVMWKFGVVEVQKEMEEKMAFCGVR